MKPDIRQAVARFYDFQPSPFADQDIPFYLSQLPKSNCRVLELGCGTGRVLIPLAGACEYIQGVDISASMIAICQEKLAQQDIPAQRARAEVGDMTRLDLKRTFDLIIAPFRAFQNLETDEELEGFFQTVRQHLSDDGRCILNVFRPFADEPTLRKVWAERTADQQRWEHPLGKGRLIGYDRIAGVHPQKLVVYPVLSYRYYEGEDLKDEADTHIAMRCYYPDEFEDLIAAHGFQVHRKWGGYSGEGYGEGTELVIQFALA